MRSDIAPALILQPDQFGIVEGHTASLHAWVFGAPPLSCQWRKDGQDLVDQEFLTGSRNARLTWLAATDKDAGGYQLVLNNAYGCITSTVTRLRVWPETGFALWMENNALEGDPEVWFGAENDGVGLPNGFVYAFGSNLVQDVQLLNVLSRDGRPVADVLRLDDSAVPYVDLMVECCTNLCGAPTDWTVPLRPATDASGKPDCRLWFETQEPEDSAFFRLRVRLR